MRELMLVLTESCNLACRYCYEKQEGHGLDFESAKKILDKELSSVSELPAVSDSRVQISFFGGEPFLNFSVMRQVYEYVEKEYGECDVTYAATTNGTLIHGEIQKWLKERKDRFHITLSLDGTPAMHDRSRADASGRGSFGQIDRDFFLKTWPGCVAKMTISPDTACDFANGIIYLEGLGFRCKANFASGVEFDLGHQEPIILKNMMQLVDYYSANDIPLCFMLDLNLKQILKPVDGAFRYCGAGTRRHCYDAQGDGWYPCQGLTPMAVAGRSTVFRECSFAETFLYHHCRTCLFVRLCRTCYAMNHSATGNVWKPDGQICYLNRLCMLTSARIQYNRMKRGQVTDPALMKAVLLIAKELNGLAQDIVRY
ncbi:MAG: 4Fe-4S cluster-binding domain-containing protein [Lachnospiraceae bacterium]|nr:4Fe-4S cluster-binding domain-containing protein [Lachnospiraceae bacterium]